nr:MAG TPA: hypothetical protein [Caudoviricetes sp.]
MSLIYSTFYKKVYTLHISFCCGAIFCVPLNILGGIFLPLNT